MPSTPSTITWRPCADGRTLHAAVSARIDKSSASRKVYNRFSFHPGRSVDAEQTQRGGRHIFNSRIVRIELQIREEHSRNQMRIHAMIAAPGLQIVFENIRRHLAHSRVPRSPVAARVAD